MSKAKLELKTKYTIMLEIPNMEPLIKPKESGAINGGYIRGSYSIPVSYNDDKICKVRYVNGDITCIAYINVGPVKWATSVIWETCQEHGFDYIEATCRHKSK